MGLIDVFRKQKKKRKISNVISEFRELSSNVRDFESEDFSNVASVSSTISRFMKKGNLGKIEDDMEFMIRSFNASLIKYSKLLNETNFKETNVSKEDVERIISALKNGKKCAKVVIKYNKKLRNIMSWLRDKDVNKKDVKDKLEELRAIIQKASEMSENVLNYYYSIEKLSRVID